MKVVYTGAGAQTVQLRIYKWGRVFSREATIPLYDEIMKAAKMDNNISQDCSPILIHDPNQWATFRAKHTAPDGAITYYKVQFRYEHSEAGNLQLVGDLVPIEDESGET